MFMSSAGTGFVLVQKHRNIQLKIRKRTQSHKTEDARLSQLKTIRAEFILRAEHFSD